MNLIDIAWAAGLFEGEGCVYTQRYTKRNTETPSASMVTTDEDVIRRFCSVIGIGRINGPYKGKGEFKKNGEPKKPYWHWNVKGFEKVQYVVALFWNQLGARRRHRAVEILAAAKLRPVQPAKKTHCPQGHPYNDSNTYRPPSGNKTNRMCRTCMSARLKRAA